MPSLCTDWAPYEYSDEDCDGLWTPVAYSDSDCDGLWTEVEVIP